MSLWNTKAGQKIPRLFHFHITCHHRIVDDDDPSVYCAGCAGALEAYGLSLGWPKLEAATEGSRRDALMTRFGIWCDYSLDAGHWQTIIEKHPTLGEIILEVRSTLSARFLEQRTAKFWNSCVYLNASTWVQRRTVEAWHQKYPGQKIPKFPRLSATKTAAAKIRAGWMPKDMVHSAIDPDRLMRWLWVATENPNSLLSDKMHTVPQW